MNLISFRKLFLFLGLLSLGACQFSKEQIGTYKDPIMSNVIEIESSRITFKGATRFSVSRFANDDLNIRNYLWAGKDHVSYDAEKDIYRVYYDIELDRELDGRRYYRVKLFGFRFLENNSKIKGAVYVDQAYVAEFGDYGVKVQFDPSRRPTFPVSVIKETGLEE